MSHNYLASNFTLTGIPLSELPALADAQLDPRAYSKIDGVGANLTEISAAYTREWLNTHFGICGVGWGYSYDPADLKLEVIPQTFKRGTPGEYTKDQWFATLRSFNFWYKTQDAEGNITPCELQASGANDNAKQAYALKGAVTSAISNAISLIGFQSSVYKGERTHITVRQPPRAAAQKPAAQVAAKPKAAQPAPKAASKPKASATGDPADHIVPIGNAQGARLGDQDPKAIQFYARMKTDGNPELIALQNAATQMLAQLQSA